MKGLGQWCSVSNSDLVKLFEEWPIGVTILFRKNDDFQCIRKYGQDFYGFINSFWESNDILKCGYTEIMIPYNLFDKCDLSDIITNFDIINANIQLNKALKS